MGSYNITIVTSQDTDDLFPKMVAQYNLKHTTTYTPLQYAQKIASEAIESQTQLILTFMGR